MATKVNYVHSGVTGGDRGEGTTRHEAATARHP
ncbi:hypothetical protein EV191_102205 [Tamaricihabitans halophyticus]|uniref:Uncharacterized protein n=1 Tax=Tamaricihabitans halophyticus TaxID=1262583 RepID=A0A4R2R008_9PSEU|nr:hypothetical protein EV191_102205 [Tamaricihabitans halophyticus]